MKEELIAPCGMNCSLCIGYLAMKNEVNKKGLKRVYCEGCIPRGKNCLHMGDQCQLLGKGLVRFCYECKDFPCKRLKALDKRYSTKYHMSMIENLIAMRDSGLESFFKKEAEKWTCPDCGNMVCCHIGLCLNCKLDILLKNRKYRWDQE